MSTEVYTKLLIALCKFIERASTETAEPHEVEALPKIVSAVVELVRFRTEDDNYYVIERLEKELEACKKELEDYEKKKPTTVEEKILKIMSLALEIDPPESESSGEDTTAVFVNWSPHCNSLSVNVFFNGWKAGAEPDERFYVYTYYEEADKRLDEIIAMLENIRKS